MPSAEQEQPSPAEQTAEDTDERPHALLGTCLSGRYVLVRQVGRGATGVVYEARDRAHGDAPVAIKLLSDLRARALYRLKNEFRGLADVAHPNLVGLHGLGNDGPAWYVVMDLVRGCDLLSYVRADPDGFSEARLRSAIVQLACGVHAIHAAGKLHRDLKPSNVLVTDEGRVVIVDFGLVSDQHEGGVGPTRAGWFEGTPSYAAPEQGLGEALGQAADLYAVGVILYQAMTGKLPFEGRPLDVLLEKARRDAPVPEVSGRVLPADLVGLCTRLLARDARARPDVATLVSELGHAPVAPVMWPSSAPFVGRAAELDELARALRRARAGAPIVAHVCGPSGIGKSSFVAHFAELVRRTDHAVVLQGRCFAAERVPYRAFDAVVDSLGHYLASLSDAEAASFMPRDAALLARIFPTLERVRVLMQMPPRSDRVGADASTRERAFAALKELLARIADRHALVVIFDDVQWGDADSAALLLYLLTEPSTPSGLFVCAYRGEEIDASPLLVRLRKEAPPPSQTLTVSLAPLDPTESRALAAFFLGPDARAEVPLVAEESHGSPFFIRELARHGGRCGRTRSLHVMLAARLAELDAEARRLLDVVCAASHPLTLAVALRAAAVPPRAQAQLLAASLVRLCSSIGGPAFESYHDQVREVVTGALSSAARAALHARIFDALEHAGDGDPELLVEHALLAGQPERAARHAVRGADQATRKFAFTRALELSELALRLAVDPGERRQHALRVARATANAGRVIEAAALYERLADEGSADDRQDLSREGMLLYLLGGHTESGERLMRSLCKELGVWAAPKRALLAYAALCWLLLRYLVGPKLSALPAPTDAPPESAASTREERRLALIYAGARGLTAYALWQGFHYLTLALVETRRARNVRYWPLAVAWETTTWAGRAGRLRPRDEQALRQAIALAERGDDTELCASVLAAAAAAYAYTGRLDAAEEALDRAERVLAKGGRSVLPVCNTIRNARLGCWHERGALEQVIAHADGWLAEARAHGDRFGELVVQVLGSQRFLARDDPQGARDALAVLDTEFGRASPHAADAWWACDVELYCDEPARALAACRAVRTSRAYPATHRAPIHKAWSSFSEARAALGCGAHGIAGAHVALARRHARQLARSRYAGAAPMAAQVRATLAFQRGDLSAACAELARAQQGFAALGFTHLALAAGHRLGELVGGERGSELTERARRGLRAQGIQVPERWVRMLLPGFSPPPARGCAERRDRAPCD